MVKGVVFSLLFFALTPDKSDMTLFNVLLFASMYTGAATVLGHLTESSIATLDMIVYGKIMELVFQRAYPPSALRTQRGS